MDRSIPPAAALLLDFIGDIEAPKGYDTIYGNNQDKLKKRLTSMTLAEVQTQQREWTRRFRSSAAGRYQFMRNTLEGLIKELKLDTAQKFTADLQDRLAYVLLRRRGYDAFMNQRISVSEFGKRLAQEWASFPVLAGTQGAHRYVREGETFYAGDGLNKSLVKPEQVRRMLDKMQTMQANKDVVPAKHKTKNVVAASVAVGTVVGTTATVVAPAATVVAPAATDFVTSVTATVEVVRPVIDSVKPVIDSVKTVIDSVRPVIDNVTGIMSMPIIVIGTGLVIVGVGYGIYKWFRR
jgi:muramidase (phage lysozyme)